MLLSTTFNLFALSRCLKTCRQNCGPEFHVNQSAACDGKPHRVTLLMSTVRYVWEDRHNTVYAPVTLNPISSPSAENVAYSMFTVLRAAPTCRCADAVYVVPGSVAASTNTRCPAQTKESSKARAAEALTPYLYYN